VSRPTTACACNQQLQVILAGKPETIACTRGEGHAGDHYARVAWSPRLAAPPPDRRT
jgi:hypothetical protein